MTTQFKKRPGVKLCFEDWYYVLKRLDARKFKRFFRMMMDYESKCIIPDLSKEIPEIRILFRYLKAVSDYQKCGYEIDEEVGIE